MLIRKASRNRKKKKFNELYYSMKIVGAESLIIALAYYK
jgi:hypothetical protein